MLASWRLLRQPKLQYGLVVAAILGLLLQFYWPTLHDGLFADDFTAMAMLDGTFAAHRGGFDLFDFANGKPDDVSSLQRLGSLPWWAPPDFRISFLRPLSSALWHVDRALFGDAYGAYHAHSLAVFFALVIATAVLYRRLFTLPVAALALAIFAVDDSHHFPVVWLSNRGGIYAVLCGVLSLGAHLRWREERGSRYAWASTLAMLVGLLFGEWALPMLAYIIAFELIGTSDRPGARALALLPTLLPSLVFLVCRSALHYGARGSGAYIDPGVEPLRFLLAVTHRVPVFFADMLWNIPSEWWDHGTPWRDELLSLWLIPPTTWVSLPRWPLFHLLLGVLAIAALAVAVRFFYRGLTHDEQRHVRWLLLGSFGALLPVVGSFASTRLTIAAMLGIAPMFALLLREVGRRLAAMPRLRPVPFAASFAIVLAIVHMQLYTPLQGDVQAQVDHYLTTTQWVLGADVDPQLVSRQRIVLLAGAEFTTTFYFSYIWAHDGRPLPLSYYPITASPCAHYVQRTGDNELLMRSLGGYYLDSGEENMFRSPKRTWREGESMHLDGMRITTEQVQDGVPGALRLTFDRTLDDPTLVLLVAMPFGLVRFQPPPLGEQRLIARAAFPSWFDLQRHHYLLRIAPLPEMLQFGSVPWFVTYKPGG
jgi:hypothetical protein